MSSLNLEQHEPAPAKKKNNRNLKIFLGIGALIAVPAIGTTLAASITVNGGSVQFGQGISQAVACDPSVTLTPASSFSNQSDTPTVSSTFKLGQITLSNVDNSSGACSGKTFSIRAYDNTAGAGQQTLTAGALDNNLLQIKWNGSAWDTSTVANTGQLVGFSSSDSSTVTITLPSAKQPLASSIYKFTVETS
jgi:hypothetical protein